MRGGPTFMIVLVAAIVSSGCAGMSMASVDVDLRQTDDRNAATTDVELPDGRTARINAGEVVLRDDVEVTWATVDADDDWPSRVLLVSSDRPLLVPDTRDRTDDGDVVLAARPFDLAFERGEVDYGEMPTTPAVHVDAGGPTAVGVGSADSSTVCVEVIDEEPAYGADLVVPGQRTSVTPRGSDGTLHLACSSSTDDTGPITPYDNVAALVEAGTVAAPAERPDVGLRISGPGDTITVSIRPGLYDADIRVPSEPSTMGVFNAVAIWLPGAEDPAQPLPARTGARDRLDIELPIAPLDDLRVSPANRVEVCVEVVATEQPPNQVNDQPPYLICERAHW